MVQGLVRQKIHWKIQTVSYLLSKQSQSTFCSATPMCDHLSASWSFTGDWWCNRRKAQRTELNQQLNGSHKRKYTLQAWPQPDAWHDLKRAIYTRHPNNISEMKQFCNGKWSKIPPDFCVTGLIHNYRKCLVEYIAAKRGETVIKWKGLHAYFFEPALWRFTAFSIDGWTIMTVGEGSKKRVCISLLGFVQGCKCLQNVCRTKIHVRQRFQCFFFLVARTLRTPCNKKNTGQCCDLTKMQHSLASNTQDKVFKCWI